MSDLDEAAAICARAIRDKVQRMTADFVKDLATLQGLDVGDPSDHAGYLLDALDHFGNRHVARFGRDECKAAADDLLAEVTQARVEEENREAGHDFYRGPSDLRPVTL